MLLDKIVDVEGLIAAQIGVPGPVEHGHGLVVLDSAHVLVGEGGAAETVGKYPGVRHDLVGVQQAVLGDNVLLGSGVIAVNGFRNTGHLQKGYLGGLCKGDVDLPVELGFHTALIYVAVGGGWGHLPYAYLTIDVLDDQQILSCRLCVKGEGVVGVVHKGLESLVCDGFARDGGLVVGVPFVECQGSRGILRRPGGHTDSHLVEGGAVGQTQTHAGAFAHLLGGVGVDGGGLKGTDGCCLVGGDVILACRGEGNGGDKQYQGENQGENANTKTFHDVLLILLNFRRNSGSPASCPR